MPLSLPLGPGVTNTNEHYQVWCFNKAAACFTSGSPADVNLRLKPEDRLHLEQIANTILHSTPGFPKDKCIRVSARFQETTTVFTYQSTQTSSLFGNECQAKRCYAFHGSDLYTAALAINAATRSKTQTLMNQLEPGFNRAHLEIHEQLTAHTIGVQKRNLQTYFDATLGSTAFGRSFFDDNNEDAYHQSILRCRYQIPESQTASAWRVWSWTGANEVQVNQETSTVKFECWSSLGRVHASQFQLIIHPTVQLDICPQFVRTVFSQSLTTTSPTNAPSEMCNVPGSDFAELSFHFNNWIGRDPATAEKNPLYFWDLKCTAKFDHGDGVVQDYGGGTSAFIINRQGPKTTLTNGATEPTYQIIKRLGVSLRTTAQRTRVLFRCNVRYKDRTSAAKLYEENCDRVITFRHCDHPEFPIDGELVIKNVASIPCCSTGKCTQYFGTAFACKKLGADDQLKRCEPIVPFWMALLQGSGDQPTERAVTAALLASTILVAAAAVQRLRRSTAIVTALGEPLL